MGPPIDAGTTTTVVGVVGKYSRKTTVANCTETVGAPGPATVPCKDITVLVTFLTSNNAKLGTSTTRSSQASARVYQ